MSKRFPLLIVLLVAVVAGGFFLLSDRGERIKLKDPQAVTFSDIKDNTQQLKVSFPRYDNGYAPAQSEIVALPSHTTNWYQQGEGDCLAFASLTFRMMPEKTQKLFTKNQKLDDGIWKTYSPVNASSSGNTQGEIVEDGLRFILLDVGESSRKLVMFINSGAFPQGGGSCSQKQTTDSTVQANAIAKSAKVIYQK